MAENTKIFLAYVAGKDQPKSAFSSGYTWVTNDHVTGSAPDHCLPEDMKRIAEKQTKDSQGVEADASGLVSGE